VVPLEPVTGRHYPRARDCGANTGSGTLAWPAPNESFRSSRRYAVVSLSAARGRDLVRCAKSHGRRDIRATAGQPIPIARRMSSVQHMMTRSREERLDDRRRSYEAMRRRPSALRSGIIA